MFSLLAQAPEAVQYDYAMAQAGATPTMSPMVSFVYLVVMVAMLAGMWKTFTKAGQPGWAVLVPFYNIYVMLKIAGKPGWWMLLLFVPFVNIVINIIISVEMAKAFGKSAAYGIIMLMFLAPIGYIMLGFGKDEYQAPVAA